MILQHMYTHAGAHTRKHKRKRRIKVTTHIKTTFPISLSNPNWRSDWSAAILSSLARPNKLATDGCIRRQPVQVMPWKPSLIWLCDYLTVLFKQQLQAFVIESKFRPRRCPKREHCWNASDVLTLVLYESRVVCWKCSWFTLACTISTDRTLHLFDINYTTEGG